jgi:hypothetical protein
VRITKEFLSKEIKNKLKEILTKKKKINLWRGFIQKSVAGAGATTDKIVSEKTFQEAYPGEFEEFLNSAEMQVSILLARLKALEQAVLGSNAKLKEEFAKLQEATTEEVIIREWLAYKAGRLSTSDFYDFLEN